MVGIWGIVNFITCFHTFCIFGDGSSGRPTAKIFMFRRCFFGVVSYCQTFKRQSATSRSDRPLQHKAAIRYKTKRPNGNPLHHVFVAVSSGNPLHHHPIGRYIKKRQSATRPSDQAAIRYITKR